MSVVGVGIDLVHIPRIANTYKRFGDRFLKRAYHPKEIELLKTKGANLNQFLASRWAVKESLYKAVGGRERIPFPEITLSHDEKGCPTLFVEGKTKQLLESMGVKKTFVSVSHHEDYAIANVVLQS